MSSLIDAFKGLLKDEQNAIEEKKRQFEKTKQAHEEKINKKIKHFNAQQKQWIEQVNKIKSLHKVPEDIIELNVGG